MPMNLTDELLSKNDRRRNAAYQILYNEPKVRGTIKKYVEKYQIVSLQWIDIFHEALITFDKKVCDGSFAGNSTPETFLVAIAKNKMRDVIKKEKRRGNKSIDDDEHVETITPQHLRASENAEQSVDDKMRDRALRAIIKGMNDNCTEIIPMFLIEQLTNAEIAEKRGFKNTQGANKAVSRCRVKLQEAIRSNPTLTKLFNL